VGNFIYLLERDVEHVLRNVLTFRLVMKGSKNLSHGNRVQHTTSKGHGLRNVVKFSITCEMEPGMTCDAEETMRKPA
jgi:FMN-dependent NADH-azoreductase